MRAPIRTDKMENDKDMPGSENWDQVSRYVLEALRTLTGAVEEFRRETSRFTLDAAQKFARSDQAERSIQELQNEIDRIRESSARYREEMADRIARIETAANQRAAMVAVLVSAICTVVGAIITSHFAK